MYLNQNIVAAFKEKITIGLSKDPKEGKIRWEGVNYFYTTRSFDNRAKDILRKV